MLGWLEDRHVTRVVYEPTGRYHHAFELRLGTAGLSLAKVNPRQARRFAEAIGCNAKTDAVDAAMLARMGALLELPSRPIVSETLDDMKGLQVARLGLVKDRTAAKNREHVCRSPLLNRHAAQRLAQIDRQIAAIEVELKASLSREPDLSALRRPCLHSRDRRDHRNRHARARYSGQQAGRIFGGTCTNRS